MRGKQLCADGGCWGAPVIRPVFKQFFFDHTLSAKIISLMRLLSVSAHNPLISHNGRLLFKLFPIRNLAMTNARRPAKRFAPLNPQKGNDSAALQLKGVVFDVDGTLWYVSIQFLNRLV